MKKVYVDNLKEGSVVFSINVLGQIDEWFYLCRNIKNRRFLILVNKESINLRQVHQKNIEYCYAYSEGDIYALDRITLIERLKSRTNYIIDKIEKE